MADKKKSFDKDDNGYPIGFINARSYYIDKKNMGK